LKDFNTDDVFAINDPGNFNDQALKIFHLQCKHSDVYKRYLGHLGTDINTIEDPEQIPFLPIELFKSHTILWKGLAPELTFHSSGTTGHFPGKHFLADAGLYRKSFMKAFKLFIGDPSKYIIMALLPSYLERGNSSLVYMVNELVKETGDELSGFYLNEHDEFLRKLQGAYKKKKVILFGVSFALLDLVQDRTLDLPDLMVMETGGMKGRKKEMIREELHAILCKGFGVNRIYSEYGMTELLSQAYSEGRGRFRPPPWMKVMARELNDPFTFLDAGSSGPLNIIDLANLYSCSFIATQDLGRVYDDGSFEVLGRVDHSDARGCSLLL
jgi:hypothetical protein